MSLRFAAPSNVGFTFKLMQLSIAMSSTLCTITSLLSIPISCRITHEVIYSTAWLGAVLNPICNTLNLLFKIPKDCSIRTRVLHRARLKFSCTLFIGARYGVIMWRVQAYPESPKSNSLCCPARRKEI